MNSTDILIPSSQPLYDSDDSDQIIPATQIIQENEAEISFIPETQNYDFPIEINPMEHTINSEAEIQIFSDNFANYDNQKSQSIFKEFTLDMPVTYTSIASTKSSTLPINHSPSNQLTITDTLENDTESQLFFDQHPAISTETKSNNSNISEPYSQTECVRTLDRSQNKILISSSSSDEIGDSFLCKKKCRKYNTSKNTKISNRSISMYDSISKSTNDMSNSPLKPEKNPALSCSLDRSQNKILMTSSSDDDDVETVKFLSRKKKHSKYTKSINRANNVNKSAPIPLKITDTTNNITKQKHKNVNNFDDNTSTLPFIQKQQIEEPKKLLNIDTVNNTTKRKIFNDLTFHYQYVVKKNTDAKRLTNHVSNANNDINKVQEIISKCYHISQNELGKCGVSADKTTKNNESLVETQIFIPKRNHFTERNKYVNDDQRNVLHLENNNKMQSLSNEKLNESIASTEAKNINNSNSNCYNEQVSSENSNKTSTNSKNQTRLEYLFDATDTHNSIKNRESSSDVFVQTTQKNVTPSLDETSTFAPCINTYISTNGSQQLTDKLDKPSNINEHGVDESLIKTQSFVPIHNITEENNINDSNCDNNQFLCPTQKFIPIGEMSQNCHKTTVNNKSRKRLKSLFVARDPQNSIRDTKTSSDVFDQPTQEILAPSLDETSTFVPRINTSISTVGFHQLTEKLNTTSNINEHGVDESLIKTQLFVPIHNITEENNINDSNCDNNQFLCETQKFIPIGEMSKNCHKTTKTSSDVFEQPTQKIVTPSLDETSTLVPRINTSISTDGFQPLTDTGCNINEHGVDESLIKTQLFVPIHDTTQENNINNLNCDNNQFLCETLKFIPIGEMSKNCDKTTVNNKSRKRLESLFVAIDPQNSIRDTKTSSDVFEQPTQKILAPSLDETSTFVPRINTSISTVGFHQLTEKLDTTSNINEHGVDESLIKTQLFVPIHNITKENNINDSNCDNNQFLCETQKFIPIGEMSKNCHKTTKTSSDVFEQPTQKIVTPSLDETSTFVPRINISISTDGFQPLTDTGCNINEHGVDESLIKTQLFVPIHYTTQENNINDLNCDNNQFLCETLKFIPIGEMSKNCDKTTVNHKSTNCMKQIRLKQVTDTASNINEHGVDESLIMTQLFVPIHNTTEENNLNDSNGDNDQFLCETQKFVPKVNMSKNCDKISINHKSTNCMKQIRLKSFPDAMDNQNSIRDTKTSSDVFEQFTQKIVMPSLDEKQLWVTRQNCISNDVFNQSTQKLDRSYNSHEEDVDASLKGTHVPHVIVQIPQEIVTSPLDEKQMSVIQKNCMNTYICLDDSERFQQKLNNIPSNLNSVEVNVTRLDGTSDLLKGQYQTNQKFSSNSIYNRITDEMLETAFNVWNAKSKDEPKFRKQCAKKNKLTQKNVSEMQLSVGQETTLNTIISTNYCEQLTRKLRSPSKIHSNLKSVKVNLTRLDETLVNELLKAQKKRNKGFSSNCIYKRITDEILETTLNIWNSKHKKVKRMCRS